MRFQNNNDPAPPFGTRDRKLVFLFLGALGIFFAVQVAMKPDFWRALRGEDKAAGDETAERVPVDPSVLRDDETLITTGDGEDTQYGPAIVHEIRPTAEDGLNIPAEVLRPVRDNTLGIRAAEIPAYYATLDYVRQLDAESATDAAERVPYTMLMAEPNSHRGTLVSVTGRLRRMVPMPASENRFGIKQLYDVWIFTSGSGSNPIRVVCTGVPEGIEPAEVYSEDPPEVSLHGYFFKTQGYESAGDGSRDASLHTAPLLLAGELGLVPVAETQTRDIAAEMIPWLWGFAIGVAALLVMVLRNFAASDWTFRQTRAHGLLQPERNVDFQNVNAVTTSEMLSEMSADSAS